MLRRTLGGVLALVMALAALGAPLAPTADATYLRPGSYAHTTTYLNLRSGPGMRYYVRRVIPYHGTVRVNGGPYHGWYRVTYRGTTGYSWRGYLRPNGTRHVVRHHRSHHRTYHRTYRRTYSSRGQRIAGTARRYVGYRYAWGGNSPRTGFDCSGLVQWVYRVNGIYVPRSTYGLAHVGHYVSRANLRPGDILIFQNTYKYGISHAAIYVGNGRMVSANNPSMGVVLDNIYSSYWAPRFYAGRRI